ncbi:small VCP/p97-interacting protein isoform X1 [Leguminivora glycinivorella]|uniref:small VCP/p97-interacting protein isoform X1 n=1 Tax=Leguminivora glycinivorella TaxID=1035111 RepID=UPI002010824D|nr:small VCP/p97-interacting protein isoform X1 [Leguminivora glycinivorella]
MGIFTSCCKPQAADVLTPDAETRRRHLVEAAEKRRSEEASRGVKDPEKVKRMQQRSEEMERREAELAKQGGSNLKWTTG